jgi:hypothetical protein
VEVIKGEIRGLRGVQLEVEGGNFGDFWQNFSEEFCGLFSEIFVDLKCKINTNLVWNFEVF